MHAKPLFLIYSDAFSSFFIFVRVDSARLTALSRHTQEPGSSDWLDPQAWQRSFDTAMFSQVSCYDVSISFRNLCRFLLPSEPLSL